MTRPAEKEWSPPMERRTWNIWTACRRKVEECTEGNERWAYQLTRWRNYESAETIRGAPFLAIQAFENGHKKRQGFTTTRLCRGKDIVTLDGIWDALCLNICHIREK